VLERPTGRMGVQFTGLLAGLETASTGGWHVHRGASCVSASAVFGHFFGSPADSPPDPWTSVMWTTTSDASTLVSYTSSDFSWAADMSVYGRAIVVHEASSSRAGCGQLYNPVPTFPPPPPPPPPSEPPLLSPPTQPAGPLSPPGREPAVTITYTLTANFTAPGTVETFNRTAFKAALSRVLAVDESAISLQVYPASVIVEASVQYDDEATADTAAATLNRLTPEDYEREFGMELEPLAPAQVSAQVSTEEEPKRSMLIPAAIGGGFAFLFLVFLYCCLCKNGGRRKPKKAADAETPAMTSTGKKGAKTDKKYSTVEIDMPSAVAPPRPPGPPPLEEMQMINFESSSSFETLPLTQQPPTAAPPSVPPKMAAAKAVAGTRVEQI